MSSMACESRHVGEQEALVFVYESPFENETFNKPVVVGGKLEVSVKDLEDEEHDLTITKVRSANPEIVHVTDHAGDMFELSALEPGKTTLHVEATRENGEVMKDAITWRADTMVSMTLAHTCTDSAVAYMLEQNKSFTVSVSRFNARGERLAGFGHAPLDLEPDTAAVREPVLSQTSVEILTSGVEGDVVVTAPGKDPSQLFLRRVGLDSVTHPGPEFPLAERMLVGQKLIEDFNLFVKEHPLCEATWQAVVKSQTPSVCSVSVGDEEGGGREEGVILIEALDVGKCTYTVGATGVSGHHEHTLVIGRMVFEQEILDAPPARPLEVRPATPSPVPSSGLAWWMAPLLALCAPGLLAPLWLVMMRRRREEEA